MEAGHEVPVVVTKGDAFNNFRFKISDLRFMEGKTEDDISKERLAGLLRSDLPGSALGRSDLWRPEAIILASFGPPFLAAEVLKWPKYGCLNVHASLLPRWRGAAPVFAALTAGDKETGASIMRMTEKIDLGPVLGQKKIKIRSGVSWRRQETPDTRETLTKLLGKLGGELIVETLTKLEKGQITEVTQPKKSPTPYTRRLTKDSGRINWSKSPIEIEEFIRAVTPWPGAWTKYREEGKRKKEEGIPIKILKSHLEFPLPSSLYPLPYLVIDEVQLPGKNPVSWKQFLAGHPGAELG